MTARTLPLSNPVTGVHPVPYSHGEPPAAYCPCGDPYPDDNHPSLKCPDCRERRGDFVTEARR